ncbi:MAG: hypothetical protein EPN92_08830 [Chitinophagaceae bacterium]|nr:MAG: hypothetical protein EPN92_08830 [Chitinophagaceae bacterium]
MNKFKIFVAILICASSFQTGLSQIKENITEAFFTDFKKDNIKAYENLFAESKWVNKSSLETVKIKLKDFLADMGEYCGYELITEKMVGESYALKSFLIKYESIPVRFTFILYKPKNIWQIQSFAYDSNIGEELEEAAKAYRLKYNW